MNLADLKTALYGLLQIEAADQQSYDVHALMAFNQAQVKAQRNHDFELCKGRGYLVIPPETGSLLDSARAGFSSEVVTGSSVNFKSITRAFVRNNATWEYAKVMRFEEYQALSERSQRNVGLDDISCDKSDYTYAFYPFATRNLFLFEGPRAYNVTDETLTYRVHGHMWLKPYYDFNATDFLVERGSDYLLWEAALHLNHKTGTWLPRSEGELSPPESTRNDAWESLLLWDSYMHNTQLDLVAG